MTTIDTIQNLTIHHATKAKALRLQAAFEADYPALRLEPIVEGGVLVGWLFIHTGEVQEETDVLQVSKLPDLQDVLEACDEMDLDPELGFEEEEQPGSIVDEHYRVHYREVSSTKRSNGDWLAEWLADHTLASDLKLSFEALEAIFSANGLDLTAPWARAAETQSKGWQGRYRMNGRQVLERIVALNGFVKAADGTVHEVPAEDLAILRGKHAKWVAKQEKATKEAVGIE